jgi:hypothetical protein
MSETERHLKTWPCGCREWTVVTLEGDTIEDEVPERFEPCADYRGLQAELEEIEMENARHVVSYGFPDASSTTRLESVVEEMERHLGHHDAAYEAQIQRMMQQREGRFWVVIVVDNSIPKPKPRADGFWPMYMNGAPLIKPAENGEDALCVFSDEGRALGYGRAAGEDPIAPAVLGSLIPLDGREDFERFMGGSSVPYVALDPEYSAGGETIPFEQFLSSLE